MSIALIIACRGEETGTRTPSEKLTREKKGTQSWIERDPDISYLVSIGARHRLVQNETHLQWDELLSGQHGGGLNDPGDLHIRMRKELLAAMH